MSSQAQIIGDTAESAPSPRSTSEGRGGIPSTALRAVAVAFDALIAELSFLVATAVTAPLSADADVRPQQLFLVPAAMVAGLALAGAYDFRSIRNGHQVLTRLGLGAATGVGLAALAAYVLPEFTPVRRPVLAATGAIGLASLVLWRRFLLHALRAAALRPRAVVLGEVPLARKIAHALSSAPFCGSEVIGILAPEPVDAALDAPDAHEAAPVLGTYQRFSEVVELHGIEQAIVVAGSSESRLPVEDVIAFRNRGGAVEDGSDAFEAVTGKLLIEKLTPGWLVFANAFERSQLETAVRRVTGIVVASVALLCLSPFLGLVALLVKLDSRGPVLFRQERVGERGRLFDLLKFRTMREDAEALTGPVWATAHDPRVTRVGRFLRKTRIDELPQLWNVLRGDMYFVGPRPERPHFVDMLRKTVPHFDHRHVVKPGITGWAQINYRYGATIEDAVEKLHFDLFYIQNMSILLDAYIVLGTFRVMLRASNQN